MYENHVFELLDTEKVSIAYHTIHPPKNLVVFVHGFGGKAVETWNDFRTMIVYNDDFKFSDIIFYGYPSLKKQANSSAVHFYRYLEKLVGKAAGRVGGGAYQKIILVGHSLGAIIVRRALLNAKVENRSWLPLCKMVLFAPAHWGARSVLFYAMECLQGPLKVLGVFAKFKFPVLNDLEENSTVIEHLVEDTEELLTKGDGDFTKAVSIVWADDEKIVKHERFGEDPIADSYPKNHTKVCKPNTSHYREPIDVLLNVIK